MHHSTRTGRLSRLGGPSFVLLLGLALVAACSSSSTPAPVAPSAAGPTAALPTAAPSVAATASAAATAPAVGGTGSAAAWCAFVIEVNTRNGFMKDKTYKTLTPEVYKNLVTDALAHLDEWLAATPPEIREATTAEVAYFTTVKAYGDVNGWTDLSNFPQMTSAQATFIGTLAPYQKDKCGIKFGT